MLALFITVWVAQAEPPAPSPPPASASIPTAPAQSSAVPTLSSPPLVPTPLEDVAETVPGVVDVPAVTVKPPPTAVLYFLPLTMIGLNLGLEYERAVTDTVSAFGCGGAGPFGQLGFDVGARWYSERALKGLFADAHLSGFAVTGGPMMLLGAGLTVGSTWQFSNGAMLSLGAGANLWTSVVRQDGASAVFYGNKPTDTNVVFLPGLQQPPKGELAVQPTLRLTVGPALQ